MIKRTTRLRWRRKYRRGWRQVGDMGLQAEEQLEEHFFSQLTKVWDVRRFIAGWMALLILISLAVVFQLRALGNYYLDDAPIPGGSHSEGMVGSFTTSNPLFATSVVDLTVSRLVFAGLLKYDDHNKLVGDLAESWTVKDDLIYKVKLKPGLKWHDGQDLTADDVAFTFRAAQNPDAKSPLFNSWRGVKIEVADSRNLTFTLPSPFTPFIYSLTTGVLPKHLLQTVDTAQLRSADFNTSQPVGAGPFAWETIEIIGNNPESAQQNIGLIAFDGYNGGKPKLDSFVIKAYASQDRLMTAFDNQEIGAVVGLEQLPDNLQDDQTVYTYEAPYTAANMAFFRTSSNLLKDKTVRQALVRALSVPKTINNLSYPAIVVDEPLLKGQLGYNFALRQLQPSAKAAKTLLDKAGWKQSNQDATRTKASASLTLKMFGKNNPDNTAIAQKLQEAWRAVGINVEVLLQQDDELQQTINDRSYDILLASIAIGPDPDVFAYWHSSQADKRTLVRLNFSDYSSPTADTSLASGRTRGDSRLRIAKYKPFLQAWRSDAPAIGLYQPRFFYVTRGPLYGFDNERLNTAADRFVDVEKWMVREGRVVKP